MLVSISPMLLLLIPLTMSQSDYCSISTKHTMCQYKGTGPGCNGPTLSQGVTNQEIIQIVDVHNRYRSLISQGKETRGTTGPQPPAANMRLMVWDDELARIAQRHADQCKFAHDCSDCRKTKRFGVGQNLYIYKQTLALPGNDWEKAVTDWYEEVTLFSNKNVEPFKFSSPTGHYTQLVWAETDKVGCGATSYREGKWFSTLYTCNYGPNGNFIAGQMYRQGGPCTQCDKGWHCDSHYSGLCASVTSSSSTGTRNSSQNNTTTSTKTTSTKTKNRVLKTSKRPKQFVKTTRKPNRTTTVRTKPTTKKPRTTTNKTKKTKKTITTTRTTTKKNMKTLGTTREDLEEQTDVGEELFICKFNNNEESCTMKNNGKPWMEKQNNGNRYQQIELATGDKAEFFFTQLIAPPRLSKLACLDFRYKKYSSGGGRHILTVLAWPSHGKPGKVSIVQGSPDKDTWVRAQVTFKNVDREFVLMFRMKGPKERRESLVLALDNIRVTRGRC